MFKNCPTCKKDFENKNSVYCSTYCRDKRNLDKKIKFCLNCKKQTMNHKFCSLSCAAQFHNSKRGPKSYYCKYCKCLLSVKWTPKTVCSSCKDDKYLKYKNITLEDLKNKHYTTSYHSIIRGIARRIYKKSNKPKYCYNCGYNKFFEVCHIKQIKDFPINTKIYEINNIDNLIALCPNCHWELDNNILILKSTTHESNMEQQPYESRLDTNPT